MLHADQNKMDGYKNIPNKIAVKTDIRVKNQDFFRKNFAIKKKYLFLHPQILKKEIRNYSYGESSISIKADKAKRKKENA